MCEVPDPDRVARVLYSGLAGPAFGYDDDRDPVLLPLIASPAERALARQDGRRRNATTPFYQKNGSVAIDLGSREQRSELGIGIGCADLHRPAALNELAGPVDQR